MARTIKNGLTWFPMAVSMDDNFNHFEELHGNDGYVWLIKFWQSAYKNNEGVVDLTGIKGQINAKMARVTPEKQFAFIKDALELGLIVRVRGDLYTSSGIQKRLTNALGKREYDRKMHGNEAQESLDLPNDNRYDNEAKTPIIVTNIPEIILDKRIELKTKSKSKSIIYTPGKKSSGGQPPVFFINEQPIPGSFWGWVLSKVCNNDRERAGRIFYRAHKSRAKNVIAWIRKGCTVEKYCFNAHKAETDSPQEARVWIDKTIHKYTDKGGMETVADILEKAGFERQDGEQ